MLVLGWSRRARFRLTMVGRSSRRVRHIFRQQGEFVPLLIREDLYSYPRGIEFPQQRAYQFIGKPRRKKIRSPGFYPGTHFFARCDAKERSCLWSQLRLRSSIVFFKTFLKLRAAPADFSSDRTWLILPVVICLSQRLSHACLSISITIAKLRMAH